MNVQALVLSLSASRHYAEELSQDKTAPAITRFRAKKLAQVLGAEIHSLERSADKQPRILQGLVVAMLLLLALVMPASAQMVSRPAADMPGFPIVPEPSITLAELSKLGGITFCVNGQVDVWMNERLTGVERKAAEVHEQKHVEQYSRFPTCAAYVAWYSTPKGRLAAELEAYVAGWCAEYDEFGDPGFWEANYIRWAADGSPPFEALMLWKQFKAEQCPNRPDPNNLVQQASR